MPATLDFPLVHNLAASFPDGAGWTRFDCFNVISDNGAQLRATWAALKPVLGQGGVYAFFVPSAWFAEPRTIQLHAPHTHGETIRFEFTVPELGQTGLGAVYVGRTTDLARRLRFHLSRGKRKDGGQVKFGLMDCGLYTDQDAALRVLREHAVIVYTALLSGPEQCANRDLLELSLCAQVAPPFNIKSER